MAEWLRLVAASRETWFASTEQGSETLWCPSTILCGTEHVSERAFILLDSL